MRSEHDTPGLIAILGPPTIVAGVVVLLHMLPNQVLIILTAWTLASFPIGVLVGHCVLSED